MNVSQNLNTELARARAAAESHLPDLLAAYEAAIKDAATTASQTFALTAAPSDWQPPAEGAALTTAEIAALAARLNKQLEPLWTDIVVETGKAPLARIEIAWDVKHPLVEGMLDNAAQRTGARLGEAVQFTLRQEIAKAYEQGLSVRDAAANIRAAINDAAPWQADMLARTDLNGLSNLASTAAARLTGMGYKSWEATLDDKTRLEHAEAHGQTVPINGTFIVGGEECEAPGDPALSDAMAANCRCTVVFGETLSESQGFVASALPTSEREGTLMNGMATKEQRRRRYERRAAHAQGGSKAAARGLLYDSETGALVAGAQGGNFPLGARDETWDANAAEGSYTLPADSGNYMWRDTSKPADQRNAYKLPFVSGNHAVWSAITAIAQRLGATQIPAADKAAVRRKVETYYAKARTKYNDDTIQVPWAGSSASAALASMPAGVKECSLNGTPGYSGGGICHLHDGSDAGMQKAMRAAQADARSRSKASLVASAKPIAFNGTATVEGKISDDNSIAPRVILPDSLNWQEMPVPFMAQTKTAEGHDGAEVAGRVDEFARKRGVGKMRTITTAGELTTPFGIDEVAPMIEDMTMRYVSADLGATEWSLVDRETLAVVPDAEFDLAAATEGAYALGCTSGKIKALTLVPTQAIEGAMIALTASADGAGIGIEDLGDGDFRVVVPLGAVSLRAAALTASAAPVRPPRAWFETPEPPGKMPLTVTKEGRVYGDLATHDSCHVSFLPSCVPPPKSQSGYAYFHTSELDTEEGDTITVGKLMFSPSDGGHADRGLSASKASAYYDKTGMVAAYLRVTDGKHGIWACGALNPDLTDEQREDMRRQLRLHPPSGDWRPINGNYELICALAVAVPGFPVPRGQATITVVASADGVEMQDALIASSGWFEPDPAAVAAMEREGLVDEDILAERRLRVLAARSEGMDALASLIGD